MPSHDSAETRSPNTSTASSVPNTSSEAVSMPEKLAGTLLMPLFHSV